MNKMGNDKFRDPIHEFIEIRPYEKKIIDSQPFQRLRNIKQLALTNLVYHGAEHTRFGHSIGVMHLVTKAFHSVVEKNQDYFDKPTVDWYEQILRLIALTHDLGHAPFSCF
jgi:HD superfamily phosphohydrolase